MDDSDIEQESRELRQVLRAYSTRRQWRSSKEAASTVSRLQALLGSVRRGSSTAECPTSEHIRVAHWNILHGARFEGILDVMQSQPAVGQADLISLNEVDLGLARSGNRDVMACLATELDRHFVWSALFLELEGGYRASHRTQAMEQGASLFGLGLMSRYPIGSVRRVELPTPADLLFDIERKVGDFIALVVEILHPHMPFHVVVTHLDVHRSPEMRSRQVDTILNAVPIGPAILMGDLNTTTFRRGGFLKALGAFATLALAPHRSLEKRLLRPDLPSKSPREPLFRSLEEAGFLSGPYNSFEPSLDLKLDDVHEVDRLPARLRRVSSPLLRHVERRSQHRLDWIVARGFAADPRHPPCAWTEYMRGKQPVSDHAPITCGLTLLP